ncbi:hypothetical protein L227DRAFT_348703 [Lentinus tigrinus ALCF2SS1-6]|uniref:Uncharacterized protein n=2 Tax=Lentinus tigrinus TaxID=5365 RepID=A0A5C2RV19_9APHY|nr:hypothetical protein L227DRAFT_348703 [Lentinus tigrinus ALCF2SS1-6]
MMGGIIGGVLGGLVVLVALVFLFFRVRARRRAARPFMGGGISYDTYVTRSPSIVPDSPHFSINSAIGGPAPAPARVPPPNMAFVGAGGTVSRSEMFPSYLSTSSASGMPLSPAPSDTSAFGAGAPEPRVRETMYSTAASSTVVDGADKGHSSLSADAMLDPFVDPVVPVGAKEANPFADPDPDPEGLAPAPAQRLSVASEISMLSADVQPGEAM